MKNNICRLKCRNALLIILFLSNSVYAFSYLLSEDEKATLHRNHNASFFPPDNALKPKQWGSGGFPSDPPPPPFPGASPSPLFDIYDYQMAYLQSIIDHLLKKYPSLTEFFLPPASLLKQALPISGLNTLLKPKDSGSAGDFQNKIAPYLPASPATYTVYPLTRSQARGDGASSASALTAEQNHHRQDPGSATHRFQQQIRDAIENLELVFSGSPEQVDPSLSDFIDECLSLAELSLNVQQSQWASRLRQQVSQQQQQEQEEKTEGAQAETQPCIISAITEYMNNGTTYSLMPLVVNPPSWDTVYEALINECNSTHEWRNIRSLYGLPPADFFLTQIPTRETVEGIYQTIRYFQQQLRQRSPNSPLVISGIAVGNAIMERAILERFRKENAEESIVINGSFIQLEEGLFLHCSNKEESKLFYTSTPMLPVEAMEFEEAVSSIEKAMPEAYILPFVSWIPRNRPGWFAKLVHKQSVIGFMHLSNPATCGGHTSGHPKREGEQSMHLPSEHRVSIFDETQSFLLQRFYLLGWGMNDSLESESFDGIDLKTQLRVRYPHSFDEPTLPDSLLYTLQFQKDKFVESQNR